MPVVLRSIWRALRIVETGQSHRIVFTTEDTESEENTEKFCIDS